VHDRQQETSDKRPQQNWENINVHQQGLSQTLGKLHEGKEPAVFSGFVNLRETETEREQLILLAHRPCAGKVESLPQP
jgi:hypothetical protein